MQNNRKKCWHHLLHSDSISVSVTSKYKKILKIAKNEKNWKRKTSYLLNDLMNFNEIFRKNVTSLENTILEEESNCFSHVF